MNPNPTDRSQATVVVDGVDVTYHSAGSSPTDRPVLVMIHGTTGSTDSHYGYLFPMLAFGQRVVSIDLTAPASTEPLELEQLVRQVTAVIDRVAEGRPVNLMGYSLGAVVAAATAAGLPEGIANLVLVAGWLRTDAQQTLRNGIWRTLRTTDSPALRRFMVFCAFSPAFLAARTSGEIDDIAGRISVDGFVDAQMDLNSRINIADRVEQIRATTLVIGCSHDQMVPATHARQLFGAIEDARYTEIDSGHGVVFERPTELLHLVDTFLRKPSALAVGTVIAAARP